VKFKTVPEDGTRVGALQSGEAHVARNVAPLDEETVVVAGGTIAAVPVQGQTNALFISLAADAPTRELAVRLALQAATDREEINQTVLSPSYPIPTGLLGKGTPHRGDGSAHLAYDLDKAKRLLDEAGWRAGPDGIREKNGKRLSFALYVTPTYQVSQRVMELLQSQWKKAGVATEIKTPSLTEYLALIAGDGKNVAFQQGQWSRADPDALRIAFDSTTTNRLYASGKIKQRVDELVRAQAAEFDTQKRQAAVQKAEDYLLSIGAQIPLYDETQVFGLASNVHGFGTEAVARAWLYDTWVAGS
jgi:peptide/nickel transport system substrate-binding protein